MSIMLTMLTFSTTLPAAQPTTPLEALLAPHPKPRARAPNLGARAPRLGARAAQGKQEVLVCTNRTCRKQGALSVVEFFKCLAPPAVDVTTTGCLGKCGNGPNVMLLPEELQVGHVSTAAHVARLLEKQCGAADPAANLRALELQSRGSEAHARGAFADAEGLFTQAVDLAPSGGLHNILCCRSACRTSLGNLQGALEDVREAQRLKPHWTTASIREAQAYEAAGERARALEVYRRTAEGDAEFRRSKMYLRKRRELELAGIA